LSSGEDATISNVVKLAGCLKTESRVRMLLALRRGASRPLDVVKESGENPSTLYRIVDEMIDAGVVERTEPAQGEVHWRLTALGTRLLGSIEGVVSPLDVRAVPVAGRPWWIHLVIPTAVIIVSGAQAARLAQPGYIIGGLIIAFASYFATRRLLK
jgi:DNA-binding HxlR family transcriptional regulator